MSRRAVPRLFGSGSVWNTRLADDAPLEGGPYSAALQSEIRSEIEKGIGPWIQTYDYSTPVYQVRTDQRCVRVALDNQQAYAGTLKKAFASVPLPSTARPARGRDSHLTVYQPSTDSLWEFWRLRRARDGWHAAWGGAMRKASTSPGYFDRRSWPGARPYWGATATSLPLIAGTITPQELQSGRIDHALAMSLPNARADAFSRPAQRTDGTLERSTAIPQGAHFRLDPRLDLDALDLPPVVRAMAEAAQRYGMIVRDKTSRAVGFYAVDPTPLGRNPYPDLFEGKVPSVLLKRFPWQHVQLLRLDLRRGTGRPPNR